MSTKPIHRITLFKILKSSDQEAVIASYTELSKTAVKVLISLPILNPPANKILHPRFLNASLYNPQAPHNVRR